MEVTTTFGIGTLHNAALLPQDFQSIVAAQGLADLSINVRHAWLADEVKIAHKGLLDGFLIVQAKGMARVSIESLFYSFAIQRLW